MLACSSPQDDMIHFHGTYKKVCDKHDPEYYPKFKKVWMQHSRLSLTNILEGEMPYFST